MTIIEALQKERNVRVSYGSRWLMWNKGMIWGFGKPRGAWIVYERQPGLLKPRVVITVPAKDEELAVKYLLYQEVKNEVPKV